MVGEEERDLDIGHLPSDSPLRSFGPAIRLLSLVLEEMKRNEQRRSDHGIQQL